MLVLRMVPDLSGRRALAGLPSEAEGAGAAHREGVGANAVEVKKGRLGFPPKFAIISRIMYQQCAVMLIAVSTIFLNTRFERPTDLAKIARFAIVR